MCYKYEKCVYDLLKTIMALHLEWLYRYFFNMTWGLNRRKLQEITGVLKCWYNDIALWLDLHILLQPIDHADAFQREEKCTDCQRNTRQWGVVEANTQLFTLTPAAHIHPSKGKKIKPIPCNTRTPSSIQSLKLQCLSLGNAGWQKGPHRGQYWLYR